MTPTSASNPTPHAYAKGQQDSIVSSVQRVAMLGGPPLYFEAVSAQLRLQGVEIVENGSEDDGESVYGSMEGADAVLVYCESEGDWNRLELLEGHSVVVVLPDFNMHGLIRALAAGACPVHLRTSSEIIVETARATVAGEALLPIGLAQNLALKAQATEMPAGLDAIELTLVSALACNHNIARMACDLNYSDRTIRRKLQSLYVKLGVATRGEATKRCQLIERGHGDRPAAIVQDG